MYTLDTDEVEEMKVTISLKRLAEISNDALTNAYGVQYTTEEMAIRRLLDRVCINSAYNGL